MYRILGIDPGITMAGLALLEITGDSLGRLKTAKSPAIQSANVGICSTSALCTTGMDAYDTHRSILAHLEELLQGKRPDIIGIEGVAVPIQLPKPVLISITKSLFRECWWRGIAESVLFGTLHLEPSQLVEVHPMTAKAAMAKGEGSKRPSKQQMVNAASKLPGWPASKAAGRSQAIADAIGIGVGSVWIRAREGVYDGLFQETIFKDKR